MSPFINYWVFVSFGFVAFEMFECRIFGVCMWRRSCRCKLKVKMRLTLAVCLLGKCVWVVGGRTLIGIRGRRRTCRGLCARDLGSAARICLIDSEADRVEWNIHSHSQDAFKNTPFFDAVPPVAKIAQKHLLGISAADYCGINADCFFHAPLWL